MRIIKRVIALEHDMVKTLPPHPETTIEIPEGHMWVEGDEPFRSRDSNTFGPVRRAFTNPVHIQNSITIQFKSQVSKGLVEGRIRCILWPPSRMGSIPDSTRQAATKGRVLSVKELDARLSQQK